MSIYYKCDVCKNIVDKNNTIRLVAYLKRVSATKLHDKSVGSKDVCLDCWKKVFGGNTK